MEGAVILRFPDMAAARAGTKAPPIRKPANTVSKVPTIAFF